MTRWFKILRSSFLIIFITFCYVKNASCYNRYYNYVINNCSLQLHDEVSNSAQFLKSDACSSRNQEHIIVIPESGISATIAGVTLYAGASPTSFCSGFDVISSSPFTITNDLYVNDKFMGRASAQGVEKDDGYSLCFIQNSFSVPRFQLNPKDKIVLKVRVENMPAEYKSWRKENFKQVGLFIRNQFITSDDRRLDLSLLYQTSVNPPTNNALIISFLPNTVYLNCELGRSCEGETRMSIAYSGAQQPASCTFNFDKKGVGIRLHYGDQKLDVQPDTPIVFNNVLLVDKLLFDIKNINVGTSQRHVVNATCSSI